MLCEFENIGPDLFQCKKCGLIVRAHDASKVHAICPGLPRKKTRPQPEKEKFPSLAKQAVHYAEAVTKHITTGMETRTDEEVIQLLQICETCEHYSESRCTICGCRLSTAKSAFSNKLRMKTQSCPEGKWT